jgi:hypothetical protein
MKKLFLLFLLFLPCLAFPQAKTPDYYIPDFDETLELEFRATFEQQQKALLIGSGIFHTISFVNYINYKQRNSYYHLTNARISNTFALSIDFIILFRYFEERHERKNKNNEWTTH